MEDFERLNEGEQLKAENDFLKMKLMLEHGGQFITAGEEELPPEVENEFLKNVVEYERQYVERKTIKVFDKIGRPGHFKSAAEIADDKVDEAWGELRDYLEEHGISLDACSPNISNRELYRFTIEELFEHEMEDITVPGMMHMFIYDEFHPDPIYDNSRAAEHACIRYILQKDPLEFTHNFRMRNLRLNNHFPLTIDQLVKLAGNFKNAYDHIKINRIKILKTVVNEKDSVVTGSYKIAVGCANEVLKLKGNWKVVFEKDEERDFWYIVDVRIEGIQF